MTLTPRQLTPRQCEELHDLVGALCDGAIDPERFGRLQTLLADDLEAQRFYVRYLDIHGALRRLSLEGTPQREEEDTPCPSFIIHRSPANDYSPTAGLFALGGNAFSYGMATLILGIGLLIGWAWRISYLPFENREFAARTDNGGQTSSATDEAGPSIVGRVTGMVDCRWADPQIFSRAGVPLGQKYALESGLLEITYDTGAKVILQGPCVYEVESASGGFLSLGKLTARVEKRAEGGGRRAEKEVGSGQSAVGSKSEIRNPKSEIMPSALRPPPSALFRGPHSHGHRDRSWHGVRR